jgi:hypothetical protein
MVRTCEKYLQVVKSNGSDVRGEKYCTSCEGYAYENNPDAVGDVDEYAGHSDDGESHLRMMEEYGAYRAAGCSDAFWGDRDAGYIR